ncbi:MAG: hypothetical protein HFI75_05835 [Lachnospiraceae bacterium]|nr:hypothetical protein [Lachnospiraceae bacterium]
MYSFGMLYQILESYVENNIDEIEHAFVYSLKWPDSYILKIKDEKFWVELQKIYDVVISEKEKKEIITVEGLKKLLV